MTPQDCRVRCGRKLILLDDLALVCQRARPHCTNGACSLANVARPAPRRLVQIYRRAVSRLNQALPGLGAGMPTITPWTL